MIRYSGAGAVGFLLGVVVVLNAWVMYHRGQKDLWLPAEPWDGVT